MEITVIRNTGFYAMGSPLVLDIDQKKKVGINQNKKKIIQNDRNTMTLQASFSLLKSPVYTYTQQDDGKVFHLIMNPQLKLAYLLLFASFFLIPIVLVMPFMIILLLILYGVGFAYFSKRAYLLKEVNHGTAS